MLKQSKACNCYFFFTIFSAENPENIFLCQDISWLNKCWINMMKNNKNLKHYPENYGFVCFDAKQHFQFVSGQMWNWKAVGRLQNLARLRSSRGSWDSQRVEDVFVHNDALEGWWRIIHGDSGFLKCRESLWLTPAELVPPASFCFSPLMSLGRAYKGFK